MHCACNNIIILFRVFPLSITPGAPLFNRVAGIIIYAAVVPTRTSTTKTSLVAVIYNWFSSVTPAIIADGVYIISWTPPRWLYGWRLQRIANKLLCLSCAAAAVDRLPRYFRESSDYCRPKYYYYYRPAKTTINAGCHGIQNVVYRT